MRTSIITNLLMVIIWFFSSPFFAQDCKMFYPSKEGTVTELKNYNKKGKAQKGRIFYKVVKVYDSAGYHVEKLQTWTQHKKRKTQPITFKVMCKGDNFYVDTRSYLDSKKLDVYKNMDIDIEGQNINIPLHPVAGQKLKDGFIKYKVSNKNFTLAKMSINITNRKVDAIEKITTPAGTFKAVKISFDLKIKTIGVNFKYKGVEWYAKNTGMVRRELWNKKGKLKNYSEIVNIYHD